VSLRSRAAAAVLATAVLASACTYSGPGGGATSGASAGPRTTSGLSDGSTSAQGGTPPSSSSRRSATATPSKAEVLNCGGQRAASEPALLYVTCGDGTVSVQGIRWSTFGGAVAHGAGTLHRRSCTPNCASGKDTTTPAQVTLSDTAQRSGRLLYGRLLVEPAGTTPVTLRLPG
jgi:hypothetical protein